ncbi:MAG TPA: MerC domain-containing protein [Oculatellaceae cyanobacterium]
MNIRSQLKGTVEILGIVAPIICLIDCIALPVLTALLPLLGHHLVHGLQDQLLCVVVLSICAPVILPGFAKHRNWIVLSMFVLGSSLMLIVNFFAAVDEAFHLVCSLAASALLIKSNIDNKRLLACACHHCDDTDHQVNIQEYQVPLSRPKHRD